MNNPTFTPIVGEPFAVTLERRQLIYRQLRQAAAMASGLEAMAVRAIEAGEATPEQLDHIADLTGHLTQHLTQLSTLFADMVAG